ncbi:MAG: S8 family serine peptidase [Chloroflexi bacterium]|nr:S8 family serine peptidase [Chloroflexota bacterium]
MHSQYGLTGAGVRVAVLDSGIDTDHPDLADDLIAQVCFTGGGTPALGSCPPADTNTGISAEDENGHGTNVAGIITSDGTVAPIGFAPDAQIVAVRVLDGFGSGWLSGLGGGAGLDHRQPGDAPGRRDQHEPGVVHGLRPRLRRAAAGHGQRHRHPARLLGRADLRRHRQPGRTVPGRRAGLHHQSDRRGSDVRQRPGAR